MKEGIVQESLLPEPLRNGLYLLSGERDLIARFQYLLVSRWDAFEVPLLWLDAGNALNPYLLSIAARRFGYDPEAVLRGIRVARPFTAFQLGSLVRKSVCAVRRGGPLSLVVLTDPLLHFYDSGVGLKRLRPCFERFLQGLDHLRRVAMVVGLMRGWEPPPGREGFHRSLLSQADGLRRVTGGEG